MPTIAWLEAPPQIGLPALFEWWRVRHHFIRVLERRRQRRDRAIAITRLLGRGAEDDGAAIGDDHGQLPGTLPAGDRILALVRRCEGVPVPGHRLDRTELMPVRGDNQEGRLSAAQCRRSTSRSRASWLIGQQCLPCHQGLVP
jgi:hypothetical protein